MAIQSSFYSGTALDSRTFPSTKHIATKAHMAVWRKQVLDDTWVQMNISDYQLINNACILNSLISTNLYSDIEVRVADTPNELAIAPSNIAIVAGIVDEVTTVAGIADEVVVVAGIENEILAITTEPLTQAILDAETNAITATEQAAIATSNAEIATLKAGESATSASSAANSATQSFNSKEESAASAALAASYVSGVTIEFLTDQAAYDMGYVADGFNLFPTDLGGLV